MKARNVCAVVAVMMVAASALVGVTQAQPVLDSAKYDYGNGQLVLFWAPANEVQNSSNATSIVINDDMAGSVNLQFWTVMERFPTNITTIPLTTDEKAAVDRLNVYALTVDIAASTFESAGPVMNTAYSGFPVTSVNLPVVWVDHTHGSSPQSFTGTYDAGLIAEVRIAILHPVDGVSKHWNGTSWQEEFLMLPTGQADGQWSYVQVPAWALDAYYMVEVYARAHGDDAQAFSFHTYTNFYTPSSGGGTQSDVWVNHPVGPQTSPPSSIQGGFSPSAVPASAPRVRIRDMGGKQWWNPVEKKWTQEEERTTISTQWDVGSYTWWVDSSAIPVWTFGHRYDIFVDAVLSNDSVPRQGYTMFSLGDGGEPQVSINAITETTPTPFTGTYTPATLWQPTFTISRYDTELKKPVFWNTVTWQQEPQWFSLQWAAGQWSTMSTYPFPAWNGGVTYQIDVRAEYIEGGGFVMKSQAFTSNDTTQPEPFRLMAVVFEPSKRSLTFHCNREVAPELFDVQAPIDLRRATTTLQLPLPHAQLSYANPHQVLLAVSDSLAHLLASWFADSSEPVLLAMPAGVIAARGGGEWNQQISFAQNFSVYYGGSTQTGPPTLSDAIYDATNDYLRLFFNQGLEQMFPEVVVALFSLAGDSTARLEMTGWSGQMAGNRLDIALRPEQAETVRSWPHSDGGALHIEIFPGAVAGKEGHNAYIPPRRVNWHGGGSTSPVVWVDTPREPNPAIIDGGYKGDIVAGAVELAIMLRDPIGTSFWSGTAWVSEESWLPTGFGDGRWQYTDVPVWEDGRHYELRVRGLRAETNDYAYHGTGFLAGGSTSPVVWVHTPREPNPTMIDGGYKADIITSAVEIAIVLLDATGTNFWSGTTWVREESWLPTGFGDGQWQYTTVPVWEDGRYYELQVRGLRAETNDYAYHGTGFKVGDGWGGGDDTSAVCKAPPSAAFAAAPLSGPVGTRVAFWSTASDSSDGESDGVVYFGDGSSTPVGDGSNDSLFHVYTKPGSYTVTVVLANACGADTVVRTDYITILTSPPKTTIATRTVQDGAVQYLVQATDDFDTAFTFNASLRGITDTTVRITRTNQTGLFRFFPLTDGTYLFAVTAVDKAGLADPAPPRDTLLISQASTRQLAAGSWRMIAAPAHILAAAPLKSAGVLARWNEAGAKREIYNYYTPSTEIDELRAGQGYWTRLDSVVTLKVDRAQMPDSAITLPLHFQEYGWNQVASPYPYPVKVFSAAPVWEWNAQTNSTQLVEDSVLHPWTGYWMQVSRADSLRLLPQPVFKPRALARKTRDFFTDRAEWRIQVILHSERGVDDDNQMGLTKQLRGNRDARNLAKPPHMGATPRVFFVNSEDGTPLARDIRRGLQTGAPTTFTLGIEGVDGDGGAATLRMKGIDRLEGIYAFIGDSRGMSALRDDSLIVVAPSHNAVYKTVFITEDREFLNSFPHSFVMHHPYPNPFIGPHANLRYTLPYRWMDNGRLDTNPYAVKLVVYDAQGRVVRDLVNRRQGPGSYHVTWNGRSNAGSTVASGTYFLRLEAGKFQSVTRLTMMR